MTDEQIEQNAEEYSKKHYDIPFEDNSSMNVTVSEESYIAGAHSRDEETFKSQKKVEAMQSYIEAEKDCMQNEIDEMKEQLKMNAEDFLRLRREMKNLQK